MYRLYEMRLRQGLASSKSELPRHIAVLCDGNRRWARDAGHDDVSYGYRMGAHKIAEMLRWCQETGIEMATVYLLSTENLQRDPDELASLIEIITDVVEEICAPANRWSVRTVGDLELIGEEPARRLRDAVESTNGNGSGFHVNVAVGYGGRQEIVDAVRALLGKELANGATGDQLIEAVTVDAISENLYTSGQPDPDLVIRTSGEQRLSGLPAVAERVLGDVVHRGVLAGVPAGRLPARAARLHRASPPLRHVDAAHLSHGCAVSSGLRAQLVAGPVPAGPRPAQTRPGAGRDRPDQFRGGGGAGRRAASSAVPTCSAASRSISSPCRASPGSRCCSNCPGPATPGAAAQARSRWWPVSRRSRSSARRWRATSTGRCGWATG